MATKTIQLTLYDASGTPLPNLSGLKFSFFEQSNPAALGAPIAGGSNRTTDGTGQFIETVNTSLSTGGLGWIIISDSNGTLSQSPSPKAFCGVVQVADAIVTPPSNYQLVDSANDALVDSTGSTLISIG